MKVILDANIYISYLLVRHPGRIITDVVEACLANSDIKIIFPQELRAELIETVQRKPYLRTHINPEAMDSLLQSLTSIAFVPTPLGELLSLSRDPKDDYLLAHGLLESVDYLVTGDDDLLSLRKIDALNIVSAPSFWKIACASYEP